MALSKSKIPKVIHRCAAPEVPFHSPVATPITLPVSTVMAKKTIQPAVVPKLSETPGGTRWSGPPQATMASEEPTSAALNPF